MEIKYQSKKLLRDKASYQRFQEAAAAKKEAEQIKLERESFKRRLSEDFESAAQELGIDPYELSEKTIEKRYKELTMSEDQRKMSDMEREYHRLKKFEDEVKNERQTSQTQNFRNDVGRYIDTNLGKAFDTAQIDVDPYTVFAAATYIQNKVKREDIPIQYIDFNECVKAAKKYRDESFKVDPEKEIEKYLKDPKLAEKARQYLLNVVSKNKNTSSISNQVNSQNESSRAPSRGETKKYYSPQEFREMMENEGKR